MWFLIPVLAIGALPSVRVETNACGADALVGTLQSLRPTLLVNASSSPTTEEVKVELQKSGTAYVVHVNGPRLALTRSFDDPGDCESAGRTAALIVDGALDDLSAPLPSVKLQPIRKPAAENPLRLSPLFSVGARESLLGASPTIAMSVQLGQGLFESRLETEFALPGQKLVVPTQPVIGHWVASGFTPLLLEGISLPLGPGHLSLAAEVGIEFTFLSAQGSRLHDFQPQTVTEPFGGLRVGYSLTVYEKFFVEAHLEERVAPAQAGYFVEGLKADTGSQADKGQPYTITTRTWTLGGALSIGRHFF